MHRPSRLCGLVDEYDDAGRLTRGALVLATPGQRMTCATGSSISEPWSAAGGRGGRRQQQLPQATTGGRWERPSDGDLLVVAARGPGLPPPLRSGSPPRDCAMPSDTGAAVAQVEDEDGESLLLSFACGSGAGK